ncbi:MAG TPA: hypothetical protein PKD61_39310, partial [Polyangiaceae bacterium]|nr:hypothetical protein [Polyangiaceae bacterium]
MARDEAVGAYEQAFFEAFGRPPEALDPEYLHAAQRAAQSAHPNVHLDANLFAAALGRRGLTPNALDPARAADVWVAEAALAGDPNALNWFEKDALPQLVPALGKLRLGTAERDDTLQRLREELFVGRNGRRPKLNEYGG